MGVMTALTMIWVGLLLAIVFAVGLALKAFDSEFFSFLDVRRTLWFVMFSVMVCGAGFFLMYLDSLKRLIEN